MYENTPSSCTSYASPLGTLWLAASPLGLCGVWFEGQAHAPRWATSAHEPAPATPGPQPDPNHPVLQATAAWLDRYFQGHAPDQLPPLDAHIGTDFQRAVWQALRTIPPGATRSYGELASAIGRPKAQRAVGAAVGRNPWSVLVPCHRVLGQGGALTGYAGGLARKQALLALEGVQ